MHRNPRISKSMQPLRENTMRLGDAMKYGRALLDAGVQIHLWDGSGWEVDIRPDDSYATSSGKAATGGRRYLAMGAGLIKRWPITLLTPKVAPGIFMSVQAVRHFLQHRKSGVASNPSVCRNPICKKNPRREPYCRMCGKDKPSEGPFKAATGAGWMSGKLACLECRQGIAGLKRSKYKFPGKRSARPNQGPAGENPRIAHEEIVGAFLAGRAKKVGPRYWTDGQLLRVWGNLVAKKVPGGVDIMDAGWRTLLTRNVLNTVLRHLGGGSIYQSKHQWYISTPQGKQEWPGEWTIPTGAASNRRRVARNGRGDNLTVADIEQWVNNDEGLYRWWKSSRTSLRQFVRDNRVELEASIQRVLNRPPAQKTWRDYAGTNPRIRAWDIVAYIPGKPDRWTMQSGIKSKEKAESTAKVYRDIAKKERRQHRYVVRPFRYSDTASRMNPLTQKEVDQLRRNETFYRMGQRIEVRAGNTKDAMQLQGAMQESRVIRERHRAKGVTFRPGPQGLTLRQQAALPNPRRMVRANASSNAWNVYLRGKLIDTVFYSAGAKVTADEVYRSLVNHDGYDSQIRVSRRRSRPTKNPLTRRESAREIREIINAREMSVKASRKVGGRDAQNWQDGYAHGVAGTVMRRGPRSAVRAVQRAVQHDVRRRVDVRSRVAANPRHVGLKGLMSNSDAKNAMRFA